MYRINWANVIRKYPELDGHVVVVNDLYGKFLKTYVEVELINNGVKVRFEFSKEETHVIVYDASSGRILLPRKVSITDYQFNDMYELFKMEMRRDGFYKKVEEMINDWISGVERG